MNIDELRSAIGEKQMRWEAAEEAIDAAPRLGYLPSAGVPSLEQQEQLARQAVVDHEEALGAAAPAYPETCDLRDRDGQNYITPIRDQGECGSCVAFGSCAAVEGTLRLQENDPNLDVDLSEAQLFYCVALAEGRSCTGQNMGWQPKRALDTFKSQGVPDEACFPYSPGDQPCNSCSDWQARATRIGDWRPLNTVEEMKGWICSNGPAVASMAIYQDFSHYAGGIYRYAAGGRVGGHCVCIIGYDDSDGYWIAKNSWGDTGWGEQGFFRIGYGECGIDSGMLGVVQVQQP